MSFSEIINYELVTGNPIWRFAAMLGIIIICLAVAKIAQFFIIGYASRVAKKRKKGAVSIFLHSLGKPITVIGFAVASMLCRLALIFDNPDTTDLAEGIRQSINTGWINITKCLWILALTYFLYKLVDVIEHFMFKLTKKTKTKFDDMLIPVLRKSLKVLIGIAATLWIAENIFGGDKIQTILLSAGVGGIAIALAAKDTIANLFGSLTIFADRPFQVEELVQINGHLGTIEEVGFRSTKIRTLNGNQVVIPNSTVANSDIENIGRRPFIRRTTSITVTYDTGHEKVKRAVDTIKDILANVPDLNALPNNPPRVYFSEFDSCSLNIYISYWITPADYWHCQEVNENINFEILKRFDDEGIEFAFPTQTLYVKKD